jgi:hypothetical protein
LLFFQFGFSCPDAATTSGAGGAALQFLDLTSFKFPAGFEPEGPEKCSRRSRLLFLILSSLSLWSAMVLGALWLGTLPQ